MAIVYKVKKGDTLSKLGIPEEILKANPGLSKLSAGQVINIPSSGIPKGFQIGESGKLTSAGAGYSPGGGGIDYSVKSGGWSAGGGGIDYGPGGQNRGNDYGLNPAKGTQPGGGGMIPGQQPDPKIPQFVYSGGVIRRNTQSAINSTPGGTYINPITGIAGPGLGGGGANPGQGKPNNTTLPPNYEAGGGGINYGPGYGNQQGSGLDKNGNKLQPNGLSSSTEEWIDFENPPQMTWEEYNARLMAARAAGYTGPAIREINGQIVKGYWNPAAGGGYQQPVQPAQQTQQAPNTFVGGNNNTNSQMNWRF